MVIEPLGVAWLLGGKRQGIVIFFGLGGLAYSAE